MQWACMWGGCACGCSEHACVCACVLVDAVNMHVCVCVCACACPEHACVYIQARTQHWVSSPIALHLVFSRQGLSLNLQLTGPAGSQGASGNLLSLFLSAGITGMACLIWRLQNIYLFVCLLYLVTGNLNSDPQAYGRRTLRTEPAPSSF